MACRMEVEHIPVKDMTSSLDESNRINPWVENTVCRALIHDQQPADDAHLAQVVSVSPLKVSDGKASVGVLLNGSEATVIKLDDLVLIKVEKVVYQAEEGSLMLQADELFVLGSRLSGSSLSRPQPVQEYIEVQRAIHRLAQSKFNMKGQSVTEKAVTVPLQVPSSPDCISCSDDEQDEGHETLHFGGSFSEVAPISIESSCDLCRHPMESIGILPRGVSPDIQPRPCLRLSGDAPDSIVCDVAHLFPPSTGIDDFEPASTIIHRALTMTDSVLPRGIATSHPLDHSLGDCRLEEFSVSNELITEADSTVTSTEATIATLSDSSTMDLPLGEQLRPLEWCDSDDDLTTTQASTLFEREVWVYNRPCFDENDDEISLVSVLDDAFEMQTSPHQDSPDKHKDREVSFCANQSVEHVLQVRPHDSNSLLIEESTTDDDRHRRVVAQEGESWHQLSSALLRKRRASSLSRILSVGEENEPVRKRRTARRAGDALRAFL